eukprot:1176200-Prorocentrum_minimum.AAC.1
MKKGDQALSNGELTAAVRHYTNVRADFSRSFRSMASRNDLHIIYVHRTDSMSCNPYQVRYKFKVENSKT